MSMIILHACKFPAEILGGITYKSQLRNAISLYILCINIICTISDDCNHCRPVEEDENIRAKYLTNIYWHSRILYFEKKNYENMKIYCSQIFKKGLCLLKKAIFFSGILNFVDI